MYAHIWGPLFRITGRSAAGVTGHQFIAPILLSFVRGMARFRFGRPETFRL